MTIRSSGSISFNDITAEFGGFPSPSLSQYYRGGQFVTTNNTNVPTSGPISYEDFYNAENKFTFSIGSDVKEANLNTLAVNAGWNGISPIVAIIGTGVFLWSDNTQFGGLYIPEFTVPVWVRNYGNIIGRGGDGGNCSGYDAPGFFGNNRTGRDGGPALVNASNNVRLTNYSMGYIAGGGGGGGGGGNNNDSAGGGGGAGGGNGGRGWDRGDLRAGGAGGSVEQFGSDSPDGGNNTIGNGGSGGGSGGGVNQNDGDDSASGGGGGGRILSSIGRDARMPTGNLTSSPGGFGGGPNQQGGDNGEQFWQNPDSQSTNASAPGAGGGGWGASGGSSEHAGGSAGFAVLSTQIINYTNSGNVYGAVVL